MPRYLLDTNLCIYLMKHQPEQVARRFAQCYVGEVVISSITLAELEYGVVVSKDQGRNRKALTTLLEDIPVIPFGSLAAFAYGPIRQATRDSHRDHLDKLIAAHAKALNVILVTNNEQDFTRYPGINIENWLNTG
jgi:tRNA(fMet)-specific endonuclease VapC